MKTFRTTFLILLIPLLVLATLSDISEQDGFVLRCQQIIAHLDDLSDQYDRHHPSPAIHDRLPSGEAASAVSFACTHCRQSMTRLSPALFFFLRAPPLS